MIERLVANIGARVVARSREAGSRQPPVSVAEAMPTITARIVSRRLVNALAGLIAGEPVDEAKWGWERIVAVILLAAIPAMVEAVLRLPGVPGGLRSPYPIIAWIGVYVVFAAYLLVVSDLAWRQIQDLGAWLDRLLASDDRPEECERRAAVAAWIARRGPWSLHLTICLVGTIASTAGMGLIDHAYSRVKPATPDVHHALAAPLTSYAHRAVTHPVILHISPAWYVATALTLFFAADVVFWALRFVRLVIRLSAERHLAISQFAPVNTPALRKIRDVAANVAIMTGFGLLLFAIPFTWALTYVFDHHGDITTLKWASIGIFAANALLTAVVTAGPQIALARIVDRERDRVLGSIDHELSKWQVESLLSPRSQGLIALFNTVAASPTTTQGIQALVKRLVAVLSALAPFVYGIVAGHFHLPTVGR